MEVRLQLLWQRSKNELLRSAGCAIAECEEAESEVEQAAAVACLRQSASSDYNARHWNSESEMCKPASSWSGVENAAGVVAEDSSGER